MKRFKHSLSHYKLFTSKLGNLIPISLVETIPGDTFQMSTSLLVRVLPMLAPVMHPVSVRVHHWFVPHRLVFPGWEYFITGGKTGIGDNNAGVVQSIPKNTLSIPVTKGSIYDHFGIPPGTYNAGAINLLPFLGYLKIFNEFYRDEDLVAEVPYNLPYSTQQVAWEKDYFTTARPWTQKGPQITLPLGSSAPVKLSPTVFNPQKLVKASDHLPSAGATNDPLNLEGTSRDLFGVGVDQVLDPNNTLYADLAAGTAANVNELRRAFALQRYQEARAQYGSRFTEYLRYAYQVRSSDARLQRPEYLGGGKQTISFSEVLDTAGLSTQGPGGFAGVGKMLGHGISAMRSNRFRYFCEEHGYIITLFSARPRTMYVTGVDRHFTKTTKEDYHQKELELIGQQEIRNKELYWSNVPATDDAVWGYQDRYSEYRHKQSGVSGDFRDTLSHWHLARIFTGGPPALNSAFVQADPSTRIFQVATGDHLWCMASHSIQARRHVGKKTIGRII